MKRRDDRVYLMGQDIAEYGGAFKATKGFLEEFRKLDPYLKDVCRRTMFGKVRGGFHGTHKMPCWRKFTVEER